VERTKGVVARRRERRKYILGSFTRMQWSKDIAEELTYKIISKTNAYTRSIELILPIYSYFITDLDLLYELDQVRRKLRDMWV
jgi:hypothetical protein